MTPWSYSSPDPSVESEILFEKVRKFYKILKPVSSVREMVLSIELVNGSSIVALPGSGDTIRGFSSPALIVIDEASRVPDDVLSACLPMLVTNQGRLLASPLRVGSWVSSTNDGSLTTRLGPGSTPERVIRLASVPRRSRNNAKALVRDCMPANSRTNSSRTRTKCSPRMPSTGSSSTTTPMST